MKKSAMKGRLSPWALPGLLWELRTDRRTGLLTFELGEAKRALRFRDGQIIASHTNVEGERLPDRLLRLGLVADADLQRALQVMRREAKGLGEVLVDRGLLDREGLEQAATEQVGDILARAFGASEGTYVFHNQEPPPGEDVALQIPTEDLILAAVRQISNPAIVRYALEETDRVLVLGQGIRLDRLHLSSADGYFLSRVDGTLSGRQVIELLPIDSDEAHRTLLGLICAGIVEFQGPAKAAPKLAEIATRAHERAVELGVAAPPPVSEPAATASAEPAPASSPPPSAEEPAERDVVQEALAKAERDVATGRADEAARTLEAVVPLVEGDLRRRVRRLLAEALLRDPYRDPRSEKRGEELLQTLIGENPDDVECHFALGKVYRQRGLRSRADAMFRHVLERKPDHEGARAALPPPTPPKPATAKPATAKPATAKPATPGLLGRLFGR